MHNMLGTQYFEGIKDLLQVDKGRFFRKVPFRFDEILQSALVAKLIEEVKVVCCFQDFDEFPI